MKGREGELSEYRMVDLRPHLGSSYRLHASMTEDTLNSIKLYPLCEILPI